MTRLEKYWDGIRTGPRRGGGLNPHLLAVANLGCHAEISPEQMILDMNGAFDLLKHGEVSRAVAKAVREYDPNSTFKPTASVVAPKKKNPLLTLANFIDEPIDPVELWEISPYRLMDDPCNDAIVVFDALYKPDEFLFIGDTYSGSDSVKTVTEWREAKDLCDNPQMTPNPMTGEYGMTQDGTPSRRCMATVADARFAVCEMDDAGIDEQAGFWMKCIEIGIPVSLIVHSGNKSLHAWVRVDCGTNFEKWNKYVRDWLMKDFGSRYGFDPQCQNRDRQSRLPGHDRKDGAKLKQALIYLNPEA